MVVTDCHIYMSMDIIAGVKAHTYIEIWSKQWGGNVHIESHEYDYHSDHKDSYICGYCQNNNTMGLIYIITLVTTRISYAWVLGAYICMGLIKLTRTHICSYMWSK